MTDLDLLALQAERDRLQQWADDLAIQAATIQRESDGLEAQVHAKYADLKKELEVRAAELEPHEARLQAWESDLATREAGLIPVRAELARHLAVTGQRMKALDEAQGALVQGQQDLEIQQAIHVSFVKTEESLLQTHRAQLETTRKAWESSHQADVRRLAQQVEDTNRRDAESRAKEAKALTMLEEATTIRETEKMREAASSTRLKEWELRLATRQSGQDHTEKEQEIRSKALDEKARTLEQRQQDVEHLSASVNKAILDAEILQGKVHRTLRIAKALVEAGGLRQKLSELMPAEELAEVFG